HTSTILPNGNVLVAGGEGADDVLSDAVLYSAAESLWSTTGALRQRRSHHTATLLPNGTVLVTGGFISAASTGSTRRAELYFPETGTWVDTGQMVSSRAYHTATLLADGNVLVTGGYTNQNYIQTAEIYFSTAHQWVQVGDLNIARDRHTASLLRNGRVLITGGFNAVDGVLNDAEIFNPATSSFDNTTPNNLNVGRHSHTAVTLADGRVLVAGGTDGFWEVGNAEIFDSVTNAWTPTDPTGFGPGKDMLKPRLNAAAQLLPDNKVLYVGGYDALMGPIDVVEGFDVAFTTWQVQGQLTPGRADNTSVLLQNGYVMSIGGYDGLNFLNNVSVHYFTAVPDTNTSAPPSARQPAIVATSTTSFNRGERLTIVGRNFNGLTEASGGGGSSQNTHQQHPRVTLQRMDATGNNAGNSGSFLSDLTREMITEELVSWQKMESSLTFTLPASAGELPYGWYQLRVNANGQYSDSLTVQAAPRKPAGRPGTPVPTGLGVSSVAWRWDVAPGADFDGYNVYSATSGIFLATVAVSGSACSVSPAVPAPCWIQGGLGPDTSALVKVAAYSMGGDGDVMFGTVPIHTYATTLGGVAGVARSTSSIDWTWGQNEAASWYDIMSASAGTRVGSSFTPAFSQTGLSTNTAVGIRVRVITDIGWGDLTDPVTVYTRAASPLEATPTIDKVSTGSLLAHWMPNTNPTGTTYTLEWRSEMETSWSSLEGILDVEAGLSDLKPSTRYDLKVTAVNGDGINSDTYADLHSSITWAETPKNPVVNYADTSNISITWGNNGNSTNTIHMVTLSTNAYQTIYSTPIAWSDDYKVTNATFTNLLTGKTYEIRIYARNQYGRESAYVSTSAFTENGGGPEGSLAILIDPAKVTTLSGTLAGDADRKVYIRVPPNAFDTATTVFLSSQTTPVGNPGCGTLDAAVMITNPTGRQPKFPVELGISYSGITGTVGNLKTLGMVRWDPVGKTCVHLDSVVDVAGQMVIAKVNHFSDFQLQQINPAANTVDTGIVFPNPMYTRSQGYVTFDRFPASARVRVFTLHGEEVFEGLTNSIGLLTWRVENKVGRPVASGLYLAVIEAKGDKKIHKIAVIR
ncbi:MAG TPA: hypothetical protein DD417_19290, partial [Elusimicrobia bacterium]|nr:hypothetical protein [Elusimicrobiota bacterium]